MEKLSEWEWTSSAWVNTCFFMVKYSELSPELRSKLGETVVASVNTVSEVFLWRKEGNNQNKDWGKKKSNTPKDGVIKK